MGQCSTLPTEGRSANNATRSTESTVSVKGGRDDHRSSHHRHSSPKISMGSHSKQRSGGGLLQVQTAGQQQPMGMHTEQIQPHQGRNPSPNCGDDPMDEDNGRDGVPQPPDVAVRTRCYKLNLDSELYPQSTICLGPFTDPPPPLTYSGSTDSSQFTNPTQVAIQTAKIFRGITVSKDGTILSQNARATRSAGRSSKNKKGEKSRQATKIEQAKDLVEESILTGKAPDSGEPANMVSLVIMGEYDDMKYLVRDGSKKLRDARKLPDDALLAINRNRASVEANNNQDNMSAQPSPRKRGSPHYSQRVSPLQTNGSSRNLPPQGGPAPPKLKGHPRDRPTSRRSHSEHTRNGSTHHRDFSSMQEDRSGPQPQTPNGGEGGDWSNALSFSRGLQTIWNCGGTGEDSGTISPTAHVTSPKHTGGATPTSHHHQPHHNHHPQQQQHSSSHHHHHPQQNPYSAHPRPMYEGRENNNIGQTREGGVTTRG